MKEIIQKAIEGGYDVKHGLNVPDNSVPNMPWLDVATKMWKEICFDPLFWQALGKSFGKENEMLEFNIWSSVSSSDISKTYWWVAQWHMFIDHLAEGKDPEEFFNQLLK